MTCGDRRSKTSTSITSPSCSTAWTCLAGDDAFVSLRKQRPRHRTLKRLEEKNKQYIDVDRMKTKAAEEEAKEQLDKLQKRASTKRSKRSRANNELDERTKEIRVLQLQEIANRRLDVDKTNIEDQKRKKILESQGETEEQIRQTQNEVLRRGDRPAALATADPRTLGLRHPAPPREPGGEPESIGFMTRRGEHVPCTP